MLRDRIILSLGSGTALTVLITALLVVWQTDLSQTTTTLQYALVDGQPEILTKSPEYLYTFVAAASLFVLAGWVIAYRLYKEYKSGAYLALLLTQVSLVFNLVISQAILSL